MTLARVAAVPTRTFVLAAGVALAALVSLGLGAANVPLSSLVPALLEGDQPLHRLIWEVRAPRIVLAAAGSSRSVRRARR